MMASILPSCPMDRRSKETHEKSSDVALVVDTYKIRFFSRCGNEGVTRFTTLLSNWSGSEGYCIEIGNGAWDSWTRPFMKRTPIACDKFEEDTILVPKETAWFGYFPNGSWAPNLPAQEMTLYTEDWIGLKALDEVGKVKFVKVPGGHLQVSYGDMKEHILPYLVENATTQDGERLQLYDAKGSS